MSRLERDERASSTQKQLREQGQENIGQKSKTGKSRQGQKKQERAAQEVCESEERDAQDRRSRVEALKREQEELRREQDELDQKARERRSRQKKTKEQRVRGKVDPEGYAREAEQIMEIVHNAPAQTTPTRARPVGQSISSTSVSDGHPSTAFVTPPASPDVKWQREQEQTLAAKDYFRPECIVHNSEPITPSAVSRSRSRKDPVQHTREDKGPPNADQSLSHGLLTPPTTPPESNDLSPDLYARSALIPSSGLPVRLLQSIKDVHATIPSNMHSHRGRSEYVAKLILPSPSPKQGYIYVYKIGGPSTTSRAETVLAMEYTKIESDWGPIYTYFSLADILCADDVTWPSALPLGETVKVKIGYSKNVPQRMKRWLRQCKVDHISVVSVGSGGGDCKGIWVKDVKRAERLLHLILDGKNVKKVKCEGCGMKHKEWFEMEVGGEMAGRLEKDIVKCIELVNHGAL
ncbi:meiotically up-regulated gene 113-domain-containing protein [Elsinoe ampelina]|uniref:Meiotically up-regulated gene 113-domain-containing protein n=1 Tax=Elsinoe ampelina TaxID=302913 RepID=A0A6A6GQM4_9PEZI|nr:meiotically up-regulated gene 113-domain-containing protein [Elsinoe ampelina]